MGELTVTLPLTVARQIELTYVLSQVLRLLTYSLALLLHLIISLEPLSLLSSEEFVLCVLFLILLVFLLFLLLGLAHCIILPHLMILILLLLIPIAVAIIIILSYGLSLIGSLML